MDRASEASNLLDYFASCCADYTMSAEELRSRVREFAAELSKIRPEDWAVVRADAEHKIRLESIRLLILNGMAGLISGE